ncbi:DNA mismatch repair protein MutS [Roseofilum sp. BLCC_M114]|uniref:DNA mismatch repair protein MutS n=2 Tax=Roseofilum TaxID=1233426 RepID=A0ABT7B118_9CYAN|nr:DNA mismatch repair protein MutS [Roseofilum capinflatum]MDJ1172820.1 DNA mismatch repair protein MutS [Roseofilum capinflatum BLCC-M114]
MSYSATGSEDFNIPNADYRELDYKKLTPMLQHYVQVKEQYPHAVLLYRVGDFFECFFQDAVTLSVQLELALTSRDGGKEIGRVPMTGVPHHALERYSPQLVEKGYPVVVCDQTEDAAVAQAEKRMVTREITKILTPGTLTDESMLSARQNNFLAAVVLVKDHWGLAYADISTGEFFTAQASGLEPLHQELMRLQPSEILMPTDAPDLGKMLRPGEKSEQLPEGLPDCFCYSWRSQVAFSLQEATERLLHKFKVRSLEGMGCDRIPLGVRAAGGLLEYVEETQKQNAVTLQLLRSYSTQDFLILDHQSRRNLEITETVRDRTFNGSLLYAIDRTLTAMGGRALRRWILQPLLKIKGIEARQETIEELVQDTELRDSIRQILRQIADLERLTGKAGSGSANGKDLVSLADSLAQLPQLAQFASQGRSPFLRALQTVPPELEQLAHKIKAYLVENPPQQLKEGGLIQAGVNGDLDDMRSEAQEDQDWLASLETRERERTGISNLKVGYNKTFGYYISISRSKSDQAPEDYTRKQTLVNEERYITQELKEREARILTAREDLNQLEYELFVQLRTEVGEQTELIRSVSRAVAAIDALCGLAEVAVIEGYCRPTLTEGREIIIRDGRHPVVEQTLGRAFFVPNSTTLAQKDKNESTDLVILTGPNASGKSCYLRQVGLIQLMAQMGSFVPATSATLGVCDRIFTRVGAVDDLATGQSTFMVEMNETANILNHGTSRSLVLLDEIGRGTATFDGLSIAWAVAEYLATDIQARTIFATHYHELNELASILENVANYQVTVKEMPDKIIFLHQVQPGGADKSYGIEAGRLAGLPKVVIERAKQVMNQIEQHSKIALGLRQGISK